MLYLFNNQHKTLHSILCSIKFHYRSFFDWKKNVQFGYNLLCTKIGSTAFKDFNQSTSFQKCFKSLSQFQYNVFNQTFSLKLDNLRGDQSNFDSANQYKQDIQIISSLL
jgi:hypothetical protein